MTELQRALEEYKLGLIIPTGHDREIDVQRVLEILEHYTYFLQQKGFVKVAMTNTDWAFGTNGVEYPKQEEALDVPDKQLQLSDVMDWFAMQVANRLKVELKGE